MTPRIQTRLRHVSAQWLATLYAALVSLGLSVLLARKMGPEGFGSYYYILSIVTLLALFQSAGFPTLITREHIAPSPALTRLTQQLPGLALGHLLAVTGVILIAAMLLEPLHEALLLSSGVFCFGAVTLSQQISARFKSAGEFSREARWQVQGRTLSALLITAVTLLATPRPEAVFMAWGAGLLLAFMLFPLQDKRTAPLFRFEASAYRALLGFFWIELATNIYHRMDIVILHQFLGDAAEVGQYAAAFRLFDGVVLLIAPVALMFFRELRLSWTDHETLQRLSGKGLTAALGIGILLAASGYVSGPVVTRALFGESYATGTADLVRWLFLGFVFVVPNSVLTQFAIATNRERWYALCAVFAALLNVALNVVLIPAHGVTGAAWAMLATEAALGLSLGWGMFLPQRPAKFRS